MQPKFSPTWGKNFMDVATAEEFYHWLQSAFLHTVFSPNTFDGPVRREDVPVGYTMTYGTVIAPSFYPFFSAVAVGMPRDSFKKKR